MANTITSRLVIIAALLVVGALILNDHTVSAKCAAQVPPLILNCAKFVKKDGPKIPPSTECCEVVKSLDVPCVCRFVTKQVEAMISMDRAVYVGRTCGLKVEPGSKCGSYTVPPS